MYSQFSFQNLHVVGRVSSHAASTFNGVLWGRLHGPFHPTVTLMHLSGIVVDRGHSTPTLPLLPPPPSGPLHRHQRRASSTISISYPLHCIPPSSPPQSLAPPLHPSTTSTTTIMNTTTRTYHHLPHYHLYHHSHYPSHRPHHHHYDPTTTSLTTISTTTPTACTTTLNTTIAIVAPSPSTPLIPPLPLPSIPPLLS